MSTKRDYGNKQLPFNEIMECYEYIKREEEPNSPRYIEEKRKMTRTIKVTDLIYYIPKEIRWALEEDINKGILALANHFNRTVLCEYEQIYDRKQPKEALTNWRFHGPGGVYESLNYHRGVPKRKFVHPNKGLDKTAQDGIKIALLIRPNKYHYSQSAERNKVKANDYCPPCMISSTSTAATVGSGEKSARKTKGRARREKHRLFIASKGEIY